MYKVGVPRRVSHKLIHRTNGKKAIQIIGQSARTRWEEIKEGLVIQCLPGAVRHMDVPLLADYAPDRLDVGKS